MNISCAVIVNRYGTIPIRLNKSSIAKTAISILVFPRLFEFMIDVFISFSIDKNMLDSLLIVRLLIRFSFSLIGTIKGTIIMM